MSAQARAQGGEPSDHLISHVLLSAVAALPVAPADTVQKIRRQVDDCLVLASPYPFYAVGQHYLDFQQVEDDEVLRALAESWHPPADSAGAPPCP